MTDKRIKSYLEDRLKRLESIRNERGFTTAELGDIACCKQTLAFIDSMQEEPVSEELIDVAKQYVKEHVIGIDKVTFSIATDMFISGAKWQKEQMMANATEVTVHIEAGNYPYIPQLELYDYDKDMPLAKEGDKYKVILIKED